MYMESWKYNKDSDIELCEIRYQNPRDELKPNSFQLLPTNNLHGIPTIYKVTITLLNMFKSLKYVSSTV